MRKLFWATAAFTALVMPVAVNAQVAYDLQITTNYAFGHGGGPDTGFAIFTNNGPSTFNGTVALTGAAGVGPSQDINQSAVVSLAPGATQELDMVPASGPGTGESSNVGGFGPNGAKVTFSGNVVLGLTSQAVSLAAFDGNIHSGAPNLANGTLSDSFVLQGGDPHGGDTGDAFETAQAPGKVDFHQKGAAVVPEGSSLAMLFGGGTPGLWLLLRKLRKRA